MRPVCPLNRPLREQQCLAARRSQQTRREQQVPVTPRPGLTRDGRQRLTETVKSLGMLLMVSSEETGVGAGRMVTAFGCILVGNRSSTSLREPWKSQQCPGDSSG